MSIAALSYSKFEIIQGQWEQSANRKMLFILQVPRVLTLPLRTDCLQSAFWIKDK